MPRMNDGRRRYPDLPRSADRIQRDVDEEIRFDLEMRIRELVADGLSEHDARDRARDEFGDVSAARDYCATLDASIERGDRRRRWLEDLRADLSLAVRSIRAMPAFATVVLVTLAIGIGANAAIYSVVRRILIDRLPYREAADLVRLHAGVPPTGGSEFLTMPELHDLSAVPAFADVGAFGGIGGTSYAGAHGVEPVPLAVVTPNFFTLLGASPLVGRAFGAADIAADAPPTSIISFDLWKRAFDGDSSIVGRSVPFLGGNRTIIGVMPRGFISPGFTAEMWNVLDVNRYLDPSRSNYRGFRGIARLRTGQSIERAELQAATIAARWRAAGLIRPNTPAPTMESLRDAMVGDVRPALVSVMAAAVLVLVITCTNIAGLFLARATSRRREMAVRIALGAGRGRLIRQLLTESALYGILGGALGVAVALIAKPPLVRVANSALPKLGEIRIDLGVIVTALATSVLCSLVFGVMPAFAATRVDVKEAMGDAARGASAGSGRARLRHLLVASQIALAVLLMVGAGLLLRSFSGLVNTPLGYSSEKNVLTFFLDAAPESFPDVASRASYFSDVVARARAVPGVVSVGVTSIGPWNGPNGVALKDPRTSADVEPVHISYITASDGYFAAVGTRVLRGRPIAPTDRAGGAPVILLSETAAHRLFGNENPLGKRVVADFGSPTGGELREVVGVTEDYRPRPTSDPMPTAYLSDWQINQSARAQFIVRTSGDPAAVLPALRQLFRDVNPNSPLSYVRSMNQLMHGFLAPQQLLLVLFALFAALAMTLAALGVYAVMSYIVATRTREFGIRSALGARRHMLVAMVLRQGMTSATAGIIVGLALAYASARLIAGLLVGVSTHDAITFTLAPATLAVLVLLSCALPAWRATRVDPVDALRAE
jgi:putative ABC transport system permease protein